ncbi:aldose epimerase family protein [Olsenella sp. An293]|uniref:aldose epimerase family protein n=1 Tax=Olsenella sp. An293 TaxID=1965626 RepID=UPI000B37AF90|nr:aldose epimerase family protein [Olsenella sp. An293]OUO31609.1 galactose-1-epimerase [Olsenella sp. An293]
MIETTSFGTLPDGQEAHVFELRAGDARVRVSDYGATVLGIDVPDRAGRIADVALGFGGLEGYLGPNPAFYGGTVGPVANRTDRAEVPLDGAVYHLAKNDGPDGRNNNHTDAAHGLHRRLWDAVVDESEGVVRMTCRLADGELGLPGNRDLSASFSLARDGEDHVLTVTYGCATDAPTYVSMTNHTYMNLAGHDAGTVLDEVVTADADAFLPLREDCVSAGEVRPVDGTPFDLRSPRAIADGVDADDEQIKIGRGYDHCLCIRGWEPGGAPRHALRVVDPGSGRALDVSVTTPGAHLYTGNWLGDEGAKDGATYGPRGGLAFEPEFYPDNIHHPEWPQAVWGPGEPYAQTIVYRFSTVG